MPWTNQWSIKIDGTEVNTLPTGGYLVAEIPELENIPDWEPVTVPIDGDWPSFIRLQPVDTSWTVNISMAACDWATYQTRIAALRALFSQGVHTLTVQVRGQASPLSATVVARGMMVNAKARSASVSLYVPKPVLA